jgi:hypothetical protein
LVLADVSAGFRNENGYVPRPGVTGLDLSPRYRIEPEKGPMYVQPGASIALGADRLPETPPEHWVGPELEVQFDGTTSAYTGFGHGSVNYQGLAFPFWQGWVGGEIAPNRWFNAYIEGSSGSTVDYSDATLATNANVSLAATIRPVANANLELSWDHESLLETDLSASRYDLDLLRAELNVQFTKATGVRGIIQWRDVEKALFANVLFTVLTTPGTALYVGYGEQAVTGTGGGAIDRRLFAKVSGQLRI